MQSPWVSGALVRSWLRSQHEVNSSSANDLISTWLDFQRMAFAVVQSSCGSSVQQPRQPKASSPFSSACSVLCPSFSSACYHHHCWSLSSHLGFYFINSCSPSAPSYLADCVAIEALALPCALRASTDSSMNCFREVVLDGRVLLILTFSFYDSRVTYELSSSFYLIDRYIDWE